MEREREWTELDRDRERSDRESGREQMFFISQGKYHTHASVERERAEIQKLVNQRR